MNTSFTFLWIIFFPPFSTRQRGARWLYQKPFPTLNPPQNTFPNCLLRPHRALCDRQDSPIRPRYFDGAQSADTYFVGLTRALMHHCLKKTVLGLAGHFNRLRLRDLLSISSKGTCEKGFSHIILLHNALLLVSVSDLPIVKIYQSHVLLHGLASPECKKQKVSTKKGMLTSRFRFSKSKFMSELWLQNFAGQVLQDPQKRIRTVIVDVISQSKAWL